jgi:hypothetical protein
MTQLEFKTWRLLKREILQELEEQVCRNNATLTELTEPIIDAHFILEHLKRQIVDWRKKNPADVIALCEYGEH